MPPAELLKLKNLEAVLLYHVLPGIFFAADFEDGELIETVQGCPVKIGVSRSGGVTVNQANVVLGGWGFWLVGWVSLGWPCSSCLSWLPCLRADKEVPLSVSLSVSDSLSLPRTNSRHRGLRGRGPRHRLCALAAQEELWRHRGGLAGEGAWAHSGCLFGCLWVHGCLLSLSLRLTMTHPVAHHGAHRPSSRAVADRGSLRVSRRDSVLYRLPERAVCGYRGRGSRRFACGRFHGFRGACVPERWRVAAPFASLARAHTHAGTQTAGQAVHQRPRQPSRQERGHRDTRVLK